MTTLNEATQETSYAFIDEYNSDRDELLSVLENNNISKDELYQTVFNTFKTHTQHFFIQIKDNKFREILSYENTDGCIEYNYKKFSEWYDLELIKYRKVTRPLSSMIDQRLECVYIGHEDLTDPTPVFKKQ